MSGMDYQWVEEKLTDIHAQLERLEAMIPKSVSASSAPEQENKGDDMSGSTWFPASEQPAPAAPAATVLRTAEMTLEVVYYPGWLDSFESIGDKVLRLVRRGLGKAAGESVRLVDDSTPFFAACPIAGGTVKVNGQDMVTLTEFLRHTTKLTQDAGVAKRQLDEVRKECERRLTMCERMKKESDQARFHVAIAQARVAELEGQLESVADRAAAAETALESAPAASGVLDVIVDMTDILRLNADEDAKHAALATLVEAVCPGWRLALAASGAAGTEVVAWGYAHPNGTLAFASAQEPEPGTPAIVPLYAAPQAAKGWLTAEEREAIEWAAGAAYDKQHPAEDTLRTLLARSSPPEVVRPNEKHYHHITCASRDADWIAALAAAGVKVKEVGE